MTPSEGLGAYDVALRVGDALERLGVPYFLGGSLASSFQGEPRATNDIDVVLDMPPAKVHAFVEALGEDFDVDEPSLAEALATGRSWNIFFLPLVLKVDLFAKGKSPFDESEFARRRSIELAPGKQIVIKSPEDSALRKLLWYRQGGGASSQQWRDVVEILRVGAANLDAAYLSHWAQVLGLTVLLGRARAEASKPEG